MTYSLSAWSAAGEVGAAGAADAEGALPFAVGAHSGAVTVSGALDHEQRAQYHLLVTATDGGQPALSTTSHLFVVGMKCTKILKKTCYSVSGQTARPSRDLALK